MPLNIRLSAQRNGHIIILCVEKLITSFPKFVWCHYMRYTTSPARKSEALCAFCHVPQHTLSHCESRANIPTRWFGLLGLFSPCGSFDQHTYFSNICPERVTDGWQSCGQWRSNAPLMWGDEHHGILWFNRFGAPNSTSFIDAYCNYSIQCSSTLMYIHIDAILVIKCR